MHSDISLGPPVETLTKIIEYGGGSVVDILTGDEESAQKREICENPRIDYVVRYPCSIQVDESVEDEVSSTNLVNVLKTNYFLDRISMEKVDILEYIVTKGRMRKHGGGDDENRNCKRQKSM